MTDTFQEQSLRVDEYGVLLLLPEVESVPEDTEHEQIVDALLLGLRHRYADRDDVQVFGRLAWFPDPANTRIRLDPDVMIVFGRPGGPRSSYRSWAEGGVVPAVVLEVVSRRDTDADYTERLGRARAYGVDNVVLVSPHAVGGVRVDVLRPDPEDSSRFRTVAVSTDAAAPVEVPTLGIAMAGGRKVVVTDEHGEWPDPLELVTRLRSQTARVEHEAARAEHEAARAEHEAARADRLAAQLRAAGIAPDG